MENLVLILSEKLGFHRGEYTRFSLPVVVSFILKASCVSFNVVEHHIIKNENTDF